jgi:hypothetical protein
LLEHNHQSGSKRKKNQKGLIEKITTIRIMRKILFISIHRSLTREKLYNRGKEIKNQNSFLNDELNKDYLDNENS